MFFKEWPVLVVDDAPDILKLSQLMMKKWKVYDIPLKIYTAASKAEAIELLTTQNLLAAVAIIDVVMETDTAGLELCEYIRETMNNKITQLYIRTGQPGNAQERAVIDRYDINGYLKKTEATEGKLYTVIETGVRQFYFMTSLLGLYNSLNAVIAVAQSREKMKQVLLNLVKEIGQITTELTDYQLGIWIDGQLVTTLGFDEPQATAVSEQLDKLPFQALNADGDKLVTAEAEKLLLIKVAATPSSSEIQAIFKGYNLPPISISSIIYQYCKSFSLLWKQAS